MKKIIKIEGIPFPGAKIYSIIARRFFRDFYKEVTEEVVLRISSGRMLDVGTGPGYLPLEMAKRSQNLEIIGIDISSAMVKIASRNAENMGLSERVKFKVGNAANLPFEDRYFDFIVSTASMHHWAKPRECIKEIYRVLKEDGEVWIYDIRRDTTKEAEMQVRRKYGWFLSFLLLNIIRIHSSISLREIKEVLSSGIKFSKEIIEDKGVIFKLRLLK